MSLIVNPISQDVMYEQVFKLNSRPFTLTPFVKHYFAANSIHHALTETQMCIHRAAGPVIIVGGTGTGKSLLLAKIAEQFASEFKVVDLACARLDERRDLLQAILFELKLPYREMSEGELRLSLNDYLKSTDHCPHGILLLIDEAHTLPVSLLDEVRLITNFVREGQPLVHLVMAGNPGLEERLIHSKLDSLNQRIAARCYLHHLKRNETQQYIVEHVNRVGGNGLELFEAKAINLIHEKSDGCPRVINQICDQAIILAGSADSDRITEKFVIDAWNHVQCIPGNPVRFAENLHSPTDVIHETEIEISTAFTSEQQSTGDLSNAKLPAEPITSSQTESWNVVEFGRLEPEEKSVLDHAIESDSDDGTTWQFARSDDDDRSETQPKQPIGNKRVDKNKPSAASEAIEQRFSDIRSIEMQLRDEHGLCGNDFHSSQQKSDEHDQDTRILRAISSVELLADDSSPEFDQTTYDSTDDSSQDLNGLRQETVVENPFDESFLHEEMIVNEYAPEVAEHNLASLGISKQQLQYLDQIREDIVGNANRAERTFREGTDRPETVPGLKSREILVSSDEDLRLSKNELRQFDAIQREVERIEQLSTEQLSDQDTSHGTPPNLKNEPAIWTPQSVIGNGLNPIDGSEDHESELTQRQRILEEIRQQQSDLRSLVSSISKPISQYTDTTVESESTDEKVCLPLEHPIASSRDASGKSADDRDMLILSRFEQVNQNDDTDNKQN